MNEKILNGLFKIDQKLLDQELKRIKHRTRTFALQKSLLKNMEGKFGQRAKKKR